MARTRTRLACLALALLAPPSLARGAEVTRVVSGSRSAGDWVDLHASLAWRHEQSRAPVRRELQGSGGTSLVNDLRFSQTRDVAQARFDAGVVGGVSFFGVASLVLADRRSLSFDRGGPATSTVLRDGFFNEANGASYGLDSERKRAFDARSTTLFRGPARQGLEYLGLGASWAVFDEARDDTKPTWIVRFETRLQVTKGMRFDPGRPLANRAVGPGYHQFLLSSAFSRRLGPGEPYLRGWFMLPVLTANSVYRQPGLRRGGFGNAQKRAGVEVGMEAPVWKDDPAARRLVIEVRGHGQLRLSGLAQSELWEMLSGDQRCPTDPTICRAGIDVDTDGDGRPEPNPGITRSPAYGALGGDLGLIFQAGSHVRFRSLAGLTFQYARTLTDGRSGNAVYDTPGRRFRIGGQLTWTLLVDGGVLF